MGKVASYCFWSTTEPVAVGFVLCGAMVMLFPETQYEYGVLPSSVSTLPEGLYVPLVDGPMDGNPIPPVCWTVVGHVHPPPAADVQLTEL